MTSLSPSQLDTLAMIERVCSSLSLVGCFVTLATFALSNKFRKPVNRLIFYATIGNLFTNIATCMARAYIEDPGCHACQFQGFLIQMFLPADAYWTLAMAINVHLTFYNHYDAHRLKSIEPYYAGLCYGLPFVPALVFLFVHREDGQKPYGNATLWCWLTEDWRTYRIALFYAPVWFITLLTFAIYVRAGRLIFRIRHQLKTFQVTDPSAEGASLPTSSNQPVTHHNPSVQLSPTELPPTQLSSPLPTDDLPIDRIISTTHHPRLSNYHFPHMSHTHLPHLHIHRHRRHLSATERRRTHELNRAAWSYTKCAILFFTAMLVTWIPSSANRMYSYMHHGHTSPVLQYMSAFVLPLQGFWNFTIYTIFSWDAFVDLAHSIKSQWEEWRAGDSDKRRAATEKGRWPIFSWQSSISFRKGRNQSDPDMVVIAPIVISNATTADAESSRM